MSHDREHSTQDLIEQLALSSDPFADASDAFFFVGGQRRFLVQQAVHALYFAGGQVLLSGPEGAGKTRVVGEICRELRELVDICRVEASVMMDAGAIHAHLADTLGVSLGDSGRDALLAALSLVQPEEGDALPVLLAIDDAQHLSVEVLQDCYELVKASAGRIRLLLAGTPELLLAWGQTGSVDTDQLDVMPLDAQETADYVVTRLQAAGYRGEAPLSDDALAELYRKSRGNIGAIHALAPALLLSAAGQERPAGRVRSLPWPHLAIAAGLLIVVVALLFAFRSGGSQPVSAPAPVAAAGGERESVPLAVPAPSAQAPAASAPASVPAQTAVPSSAGPSPAVPSSAALSSTVPSSAVPSSIVDTAAPHSAAPAPGPASQPVSAPQPRPVAKPATKKVVHHRAPATTATAEAARKLRAMPSGHFVIQLLGSHSEPKLSAYLTRHAHGVQVYTYRMLRKGKPWFVAVTGPYPDKAAARAAIAKLPKALRDQGAWLRPVSSVQADLKAR